MFVSLVILTQSYPVTSVTYNTSITLFVNEAKQTCLALMGLVIRESR